jgi:hypothetical protein
MVCLKAGNNTGAIWILVPKHLMKCGRSGIKINYKQL